MDSTLILTKSGKTFSTGRSDWIWFHKSVPQKLRELHKDGYKVVIFSNQKGIGTGKTSSVTVTGKIEDLTKDCKVPLSYILATADDKYRKPGVGMLEFFEKNILKGEVDRAKSYYVGDAAGRPVGWKSGKKKDFGCTDRKFALNGKLPFFTPEEFFLGESPVAFDWHGIDPSTVPSSGKITDDMKNLTSSKQEMIILVGYPASGKSTFAETYLIPKGYVHVNRDTHKTKCAKITREALENKQSVVVDNTNPSVKSRAEYIALARKAKIPVRCYHLQTSLELAKHLNEVREIFTNGERPHVPGVGYNIYTKNFQDPTLDEGFTEIKTINFVRSHPSDEHKQVFESWTERSR